jgi:hypothetical protein
MNQDQVHPLEMRAGLFHQVKIMGALIFKETMQLLQETMVAVVFRAPLIQDHRSAPQAVEEALVVQLVQAEALVEVQWVGVVEVAAAVVVEVVVVENNCQINNLNYSLKIIK